jgi:hypothetical protein
MRAAFAGTWMLLALAVAGCEENNTPTVQTPNLVDLSVPGVVAPDWVAVPRSPAGSFLVLPLTRPAAGLRLTLEAPYPGSFVVTAIDPASGMTASLPVISQGPGAPATGFHRIDNTDVDAVPPRWSLTVRPPDSFAGLATYRIDISHSSGGAQSTPLVVTLATPPPSFVLTVNVVGNGRITSQPAGINCTTGACSFDFTTGPNLPVPVILNPNSGQNAQFLGWTGACTGRAVCTVMMTGQAMAATAHFGMLAADTLPGTCPVAPAVTGFKWRDTPSCASGVLDSHPGIGLRCDGQGYFCCEPSTGANAPRCGGTGQLVSNPDCGVGEASRNLRLIQPGGCYEVNFGP